MKRIDTGAAFFLSIEFQETGYLAYRAHKAAFGDLAGKSVPITRVEMVADADLSKAEFDRAFVLMQYFGYLRRDPDEEGYNFWLAKLNQFDGDYVAAEMVKAFISSDEYRHRFGQ